MHPISKLLCETYNKLIESGEVAFPIPQDGYAKIDSVVKTVESSWYGKQIYDTHYKKAAAYLYFIIKAHAFTDGNKRLALLWVGLYCHNHGLEIKLATQHTLDEIVVAVERTPLPAEKTIDLIGTILFGTVV